MCTATRAGPDAATEWSLDTPILPCHQPEGGTVCHCTGQHPRLVLVPGVCTAPPPRVTYGAIGTASLTDT